MSLENLYVDIRLNELVYFLCLGVQEQFGTLAIWLSSGASSVGGPQVDITIK